MDRNTSPGEPPMLKSDLVRLLVTDHALRPRQAEQVVGAFFDRLERALVAGETIEIRGFGAFHVKSHDSYVGSDPRTQESITVPARRAVQFRTGKQLREALNGGMVADSASTDGASTDSAD